MLNKINVLRIITGHFKTLRNANTGKAGFDDILTFLLIPVIVSFLLVFFDVLLPKGAISIIIGVLSILIGLLFNVIVIVFDIIKRDSTKKLKNQILNELLTNISFSIILSIFIIIITLITFFKVRWLCIATNALVYFLLVVYLMTVLMIVKRMYLLFLNELKEIEKKTEA